MTSYHRPQISTIDPKDLQAWTSVLQNGIRVEESCLQVQKLAWEKYARNIAVATHRSQMFFDGRWFENSLPSPAQNYKEKGLLLALYQEDGSVTWHEERFEVPHVLHKRHACFVKRLGKLLKISDQEWKVLNGKFEFDKIFLEKDSASVVVKLVTQFWSNGLFQRAFRKADEIAILGSRGEVLFETTDEDAIAASTTSRQSKVGKDKRRVEITISLKPFKRHRFCNVITEKWTFARPRGEKCTCGCELYSSELKNPSQPQTKPVVLSPLTQLFIFGKFRNLARCIAMQASLVQYFNPGEDGTVTYADFFDTINGGAPLITTLPSWQDAFHFAIEQQCSFRGKQARSEYYKAAFEATANMIKITKATRGTLYVTHKRILEAKKRFTWAVYNAKAIVSGGGTMLENLIPAFGDTVSNVCTSKDRLKKIRLTEGKHGGAFQSLRWKNVLLLDMANLVATDISQKLPSIVELFKKTFHRDIEAEKCCAMTAMKNVLQNRLDWIYSNFEIEWLSGCAPTIHALSYAAITYHAFRDPSSFGLEQMGPAYASLLKSYNRGGLMFNACSQLESGDNMGPVSEKAQTLLQYDISCSYPSVFGQQSVPNGYVKGYHSVHDSVRGRLVSLDRKKITFLEFLYTYHTIATFLTNPNIKVLFCFHRYSVLGQYRVKSSPLDLLIIYVKKSNKLMHYAAINYHNVYTHSCPTCEPLKSYMHNATADELREKTRLIDETHSAFFSSLFGKRAQYRATYTCHNNEETLVRCPFSNVTASSMRELYKISPSPFFKSLVKSFPLEMILSRPRLLELLRNPDQKCFVVCTGEVGEAYRSRAHQFGFVITRKNKRLVAAHKTFEPTLFDGETLAFLMDEKLFTINTVYHVLVFGSTFAYAPFFRKICESRMENAMHGDKPSADMLKLVGCAYIGASQTFKSIPKQITVKDGKKPIREFSKESEYAYKWLSARWVKVKRTWHERRPKVLAQILGTYAVLSGKLRMLKCLHFIEQVCDPRKYRLLQINVDAILLAIAGSTLDAIVTPECLDYFKLEKLKYFQDNAPGYFTLENQVTQDWRIELTGARKKKITIGQDKQSALTMSGFPHDLSLYRQVDKVEYGPNLRWSTPYGCEIEENQECLKDV